MRFHGHRRSGLVPSLAVGLLAAAATAWAQEPVAPQEPADGASIVVPTETKSQAGFHTEGSPEVEVVFGDTDRYKLLIDRFYALEAEMVETRKKFASSTHIAQKALAKTQECPSARLAPLYAQAFDSGIAFRRLGVRLEAVYEAISTLNQYGESLGLTPDYRWKVSRTKSIYKLSRAHLREMRAAFAVQLEGAMRVKRCDAAALLAAGKGDAAAPPPEPIASPQPHTKPLAAEQQVVPAKTATFFVHNKECADPLRVMIDGTVLGEVAPDRSAAFQQLAGRHTVCLLGAKEKQRCGAAGTVRHVFVYDGWSVTRFCKVHRPNAE